MIDDGPDYWMAQQAQEELEMREALESLERIGNRNASKKDQDRRERTAGFPADQNPDLPDWML